MFSEMTFLCASQSDGAVGLIELKLRIGSQRCAFASRALGERFMSLIEPAAGLQLRGFDELDAGALYGATDNLTVLESEAAIRSFADDYLAAQSSHHGS